MLFGVEGAPRHRTDGLVLERCWLCCFVVLFHKIFFCWTLRFANTQGRASASTPRMLFAVLTLLSRSSASAALVSHGVFTEHPSSVLFRWKPQERARDSTDLSIFLPSSLRRYSTAIVRLARPGSFVVAQFDDDKLGNAFNAFVLSSDGNSTCKLPKRACGPPRRSVAPSRLAQLVEFFNVDAGMTVSAALDLDDEDYDDWSWVVKREGWGI